MILGLAFGLFDENQPLLYDSSTIHQLFCHASNFCRTLTNKVAQILDSDPHLHFSLLRLQLIELIRNARGYDPSAAINFAQEKLAPRAASNEQFLRELEKTMALLIFPADKLQPDLAALLHSDLRRNTAAQVNEVVLQRHTERREAAIRQLVRMRAWAEASCRSKKGNLPDRIELGLNGDDNGNDPMVTT